jgi:Na+/melibiose symporter-like transporter
MSAPTKRTCCGGKVNITKFGRCRFCMTIAGLCTLVSWNLYAWSSAGEWGWVSYLFLAWAMLFSLVSLAHVAGFLQARSEQAAEEQPSA